MAVIDYERCWLALKSVVVEKRSHGQKDLLFEMARIEVESQLPELHINGNGRTTPALSSPREEA